MIVEERNETKMWTERHDLKERKSENTLFYYRSERIVGILISGGFLMTVGCHSCSLLLQSQVQPRRLLPD
jgi:hypothetical protein